MLSLAARRCNFHKSVSLTPLSPRFSPRPGSTSPTHGRCLRVVLIQEPRAAAVRELLHLQKWWLRFLFRFTGKEDEVNLNGDGSERPEFSEWTWMTPQQVIEKAVELKKNCI